MMTSKADRGRGRARRAPTSTPATRYDRGNTTRGRGRVPVVIDGATHYTTTEAAALLGIQPGAVRDAIARGALAYRAIAPGQNMVSEPALEEYKRKRLGRRGRPKGAKNKPKDAPPVDAPPARSEERDRVTP